MNYGTLIDESSNPNYEEVYSIFVEYFNNPLMTKIKNDNNLSMYLTKTYCLTSTTCRYIIAFVPLDYNKIGTQEELKDLKWISFQTRTLEDKFNVKAHGYIPEEKGPLMAKINRIKITKEASIYSCEKYPITVALLHNNKKNEQTYQPKGNIIIALETWETIITFS
jgi:hypothetical protein